MIPHSKPTIEKIDKEAIASCLDGGLISRGRITEKFERDLCLFLDAKYARVVGSGTSAMILGLKALGISEVTQEVLLPTYVCTSVSDAVIYCGGKPVYYDNSLSWTSSLEQIKAKITSHTAAIIVVHIMGMPNLEVKDIVNLNIPVIEDVCQAFGGKLSGCNLGSLGKIGVYSFHATKCLTTGEGGAISTNDIDLANKIENLYNACINLHSFNDMQATLGISQLQRYDSFLERRRYIAEQYFKFLPNWATSKFRSGADNSVFFRFLLEVEAPFEEIKRKFADNGIAIRKGVDDLLHRKFGYDDSEFPNATNSYKKTISIPIYPTLSMEDLDYVISITNKIL